MSLFKKQIDNSHAGLSQQTSGILSVFKSTVDQLKAVNEAAAIESDRQQAIIEAAKAEHENLQKLIGTNANVISNINNFIGV